MNHHLFLPNGEELTYQNENLYLFKWKNQEFYLKYDVDNQGFIICQDLNEVLTKPYSNSSFPVSLSTSILKDSYQLIQQKSPQVLSLSPSISICNIQTHFQQDIFEVEYYHYLFIYQNSYSILQYHKDTGFDIYNHSINDLD